ncbi:MAG: hypothetical protein M9927_04010 [Anaerolineae bacterium]|nr:hypothetical protein [Anaerolineae bacterium]
MDKLLRSELPEPRVDRTKVRQLLQPCLERLTQRERDVFQTLHPWLVGEEEPEERTPGEAADLLSAAQEREVTRNAVNKAAFDARVKLKRCFEQRGFDSADAVLENASDL